MRTEFGPNSSNPRMRRAYAHSQLEGFRQGIVPFDAVRKAVDAASHTVKGQQSGFERAAIKAVEGRMTEGAIVFIDWTVTGDTVANFGGYVMPQDHGPMWEQRHDDALHHDESRFYSAYNELFGVGYPSIALSATPDNRGNFKWGRAYPLVQNPANARIVAYKQCGNNFDPLQ